MPLGRTRNVVKKKEQDLRKNVVSNAAGLALIHQKDGCVSTFFKEKKGWGGGCCGKQGGVVSRHGVGGGGKGWGGGGKAAKQPRHKI